VAFRYVAQWSRSALRRGIHGGCQAFSRGTRAATRKNIRRTQGVLIRASNLAPPYRDARSRSQIQQITNLSREPKRETALNVADANVFPVTHAFQGERTMTIQSDYGRTKSNRGFASMDTGKQKEIASKGGKAAHAQGRAHEFTPDEARVAGRKGGEAVSRDRAHMAAIGRAGGQARGRNRASQPPREAMSAAE
jgi:general stress protein YciG